MDTAVAYFPRNVRVSPGSQGFRYLRDPETGLALSLPERQATMFLFLRGVVPLQAHAETLLGTDVPGMNPRLAAQLVEEWVNAGLLAPAMLLEAPTQGVQGLPPTDAVPPSAHVFLTAGRHASLSRWVESWGAVSELHTSLQVFDDRRDAPDSESPQPLQGTLYNRVAREAAVQQIAAHLQVKNQTDVEELLRFLFLGDSPVQTGLSTSGANRNSTLLFSGNATMISSDDDVLPPLKRLRDTGAVAQSERPALLGSPFFGVVYAPDMEHLSAHLEELDSYDLEPELTQMLGATYPADLDLTDAPAHSLAVLQRPNCSIHAVSIGCYGARQYLHPFRTFLSRSEHEDDLLYDRSSFEKMRVNPFVARHVGEPTVDTGIAFSTALCAFDVREPRLPFPPIGRRDDDNYRTLYRICFPEQLFANLPVAAFHDPRYKAPFTQQEFESYPTTLDTWNSALTQRFARRLHHSDGAGRLREMALSFEEFSQLTPEQMRRFLAPLHHAHYQAPITHIQGELGLYEGPPWWREDRLHALAVLQREQTGGLTETDEELAGYAEIYRLWGASLRHWPEIVQIARRERD